MSSKDGFRIKYIEELYKTKNIMWLIKELEAIDRIVESYRNQLFFSFLPEVHKKKIKQTIEYEEKVKEKIRDYLSILIDDKTSW